MDRNIQCKMVDDTPRCLFTLGFTPSENTWIEAVETKMKANGKTQLAFDVDYDQSFISQWPQSVVYIIERHNSLGIMQFRGYGRPDSKLIGNGLCLLGPKYIKDLDKMTEEQRSKTLFMKECFPFAKCNTVEDVALFCAWVLDGLK